MQMKMVRVTCFKNVSLILPGLFEPKLYVETLEKLRKSELLSNFCPKLVLGVD